MMYITTLNLSNYRSYEKKEIGCKSQTTVLVGPNAVGKTNILEAIYLLATGESFRAQKIEEMVRWGEEVAHVEGMITPEVKATSTSGVDHTRLQVMLTRGEVQGRRVAKRSYKVNGVARRKQEFVGHLAAVLFRPEDLDLIIGSPNLRRGFLNEVLTQVDRDYRRSLVSYEKALRRRNKLLPLIRDGKVPKTVLTFWDQLLIKEGAILTEKRRELIDYINHQSAIEVDRWLEYDSSTISLNRLQQYEREEVAAGYTLVGPHRDDFRIVTSNPLAGSGLGQKPETGRDLAAYGSRGEQRMAVLWLKICELQFIESKIQERPVLLLDDIFSELDDKHNQLVMDLLDKQQTIVTTTELDQRLKQVEDVQVIHLA